MPMQEIAVPVGATALKAVKRGQNYALLIDTDTFDRTGADGNEPITPLCRGDEYVGEILTHKWRKWYDSDISNFTARISSGVLEITGVAAIAGTWGAAGINGQHPILMMHGSQIVVELEVPISDTGAVASRDVRLLFYLGCDKLTDNSDPADLPDYIRIMIDIDESGLLMYIQKEVDMAQSDLFTGSTYDDTSVRDPAADKFTIWRIVFHDGHAGEAAPSDARHMHVYLKQGSSRVNAEAATEHELSSSPYDLSDLQFLIAYPDYAIATQNTTYFGTAIGSADGVDSTYLRVDPPSFDIRYDITAANRGKGDVEIIDGSGGPLVLDEDHIFSGDPYIKNGLIQVQVDEDSNWGLKVSAYFGGAWTSAFARQGFRLYDDLVNLLYCTLIRIVSYTKEKAILELINQDSTTDDRDYFIRYYLEVERGKPYFKITFKEVYPPQEFYSISTESTTPRFGYAGDCYIGDADLSLTGTNITMTDNFMVSFDDAGNAVLMGAFTNKKPDGALAQGVAYLGGYLTWQVWENETALETDLYIFVTPYPLVAYLFEEAEDATLSGGASVEDPDAAASALKSVKLDAQNEYVRYVLDVDDDIPIGRYVAVFRIRDTNQVANDVGLKVQNTTTSDYRNEENAEVTETAAATYGFFCITFDVQEQDDTQDIRLQVTKLTANANDIFVDYFLIIPISNGESWPLDLAHAAMRTFKKPYRVFER